MAGNFDPYDKSSWYYGPISRGDANAVLMAESDIGVFLVRNSSTIQGDLVLCVREEEKVSHYIINKIRQGDQTRFRIGEQTFPDVPALLAFYQAHYLDTTPLMRPVSNAVANTKLETVTANWEFKSEDPEDLPFNKGDQLTILSKDEDNWWTARNSAGTIGSIPVNYVKLNKKDGSDTQSDHRSSNSSQTSPPPNPGARAGDQSQVNGNRGSSLHPSSPSSCALSPRDSSASIQEPSEDGTSDGTSDVPSNDLVSKNSSLKLPAVAEVIRDLAPNAYDKTALRLKVGDRVNVTKTNINGQWEGELNGKTGHFPFTHVKFIESSNETHIANGSSSTSSHTEDVNCKLEQLDLNGVSVS